MRSAKWVQGTATGAALLLGTKVFGTSAQLRTRGRGRHLLRPTLIYHPPDGVRLAFPSYVPIEILRNALICFVHYGAAPHIARCTSIKNLQPKSTLTTVACLSFARQPFRKEQAKRSAPNPGPVLSPAGRLCLHLCPYAALNFSRGAVVF